LIGNSISLTDPKHPLDLGNYILIHQPDLAFYKSCERGNLRNWQEISSAKISFTWRGIKQTEMLSSKDRTRVLDDIVKFS